MEEAGTMLAVIGKSLGLSLGICAVVLVIFITGSLFWVRMAVRDKAFCYILSENRQLKSKLLKPKQNTIIIGSGDDAPKYLMHPSKQFWSPWPPGFPNFMQEPVPTYMFVEGNAEPLDPYNRKALISPESLRKISDEAMLKQTWKDVRETLGFKSTFGGNTLLLILVAVAVAVSTVAAYMTFTTSEQLDQILAMLGG